jgi:hypothetical protein
MFGRLIGTICLEDMFSRSFFWEIFLWNRWDFILVLLILCEIFEVLSLSTGGGGGEKVGLVELNSSAPIM